MPETKQLSTIGRIKNLFETDAINKRFTEMLGENAGLFKSSILSAVNANNQLQEAEPMSVIASALIAASLKLPITPSLGLAHIVPYKGVATFQMGWKGFVQLGLRSGQYKTMNAAIIYEGQLVKNDQFTGEVEFQEHRESDKVIGYLFYFKLMNGFEKYTYWTVQQCEDHAKKYSASYRNKKGKWVDAFNEMALKTVVKMGLSKWGILSVDIQKAIEVDESFEGSYPDSVEAETVQASPQPTSNRLRDAVGVAANVTEAVMSAVVPDPADDYVKDDSLPI
jgi:recombination protein RecT